MPTNPPDPAEVARAISASLPGLPKLAIVLGSGFGNLADRLSEARSIPYSELPGWPIGKVPGHAGKLTVGHLGSVPVTLLCGRAHYYEGFSLEEVTFPIRVLAELGVETLLLTNAAGGIADRMRPGDFMVIQDHINFMGENPLRGKWGAPPRGFVDLTSAYDPGLQRLLLESGAEVQTELHQGIYLAVSGPSFETPAEIRAFRILGASAVGMSSVPEAIVARQCGIRVAGLSCITNVAAGLGGKDQIVNHEEVLDVGRKVADSAGKLIDGFVRRWSQGI